MLRRKVWWDTEIRLCILQAYCLGFIGCAWWVWGLPGVDRAFDEHPGSMAIRRWGGRKTFVLCWSDYCIICIMHLFAFLRSPCFCSISHFFHHDNLNGLSYLRTFTALHSSAATCMIFTCFERLSLLVKRVDRCQFAFISLWAKWCYVISCQFWISYQLSQHI